MSEAKEEDAVVGEVTIDDLEQGESSNCSILDLEKRRLDPSCTLETIF